MINIHNAFKAFFGASLYSVYDPTVFKFAMSSLAIATAILMILHTYVSAQAPSCLPGYEWVRRQLEIKLYGIF